MSGHVSGDFLVPMPFDRPAGEPGAEREGSVVSVEPMIGIDAADLLELDLPPLRMIVPDLLPEGTTVLAAPPKVGKSCLVYQIAVEVAIGGELFGRRCAPGSVLYLAQTTSPLPAGPAIERRPP